LEHRTHALLGGDDVRALVRARWIELAAQVGIDLALARLRREKLARGTLGLALGALLLLEELLSSGCCVRAPLDVTA